MTVLKNWCKLDIDSDKLDLDTNKHDDWNLVFVHHKEEEEVYPLTTIEIAEAQRIDQELKVYFKNNPKMPQKDIYFQLIEDTKGLCKNGKLIHSISTAQGSQLVSPLPPTTCVLKRQ
jgi:hypothetical protein